MALGCNYHSADLSAELAMFAAVRCGKWTSIGVFDSLNHLTALSHDHTFSSAYHSCLQPASCSCDRLIPILPRPSTPIPQLATETPRKLFIVIFHGQPPSWTIPSPHIHDMSSRRDSNFARLELRQEERRNQQEAEVDERPQLERPYAEDERRRAEESFVGTELCGLCRLQLPWGNLSCLEAWQCAFRASTPSAKPPLFDAISDSSAVLCLDPNDEDAVELTSLASFSNVLNDRIAVKLTGHRHIQEITIVRRQQNSQKIDTGQIAFCFHNWCYEILMWNVRNCTKSEIYRLARTLSLYQVASENVYGDRGLSVSISDHTLRWLEEKSSCGVYPFFLSQLPPELRHSIWEDVGPRAASNAFALVKEGTSLLVRDLNCSNCRNISLDQGSFISFKMIIVFGTAYIQDLDNREGSKAIPGVVIRLTFAMSLDGICAIKLFGIDWDTGWLGEIPNTGRIWYGTLQDIGSSVTCSYNVSRY